LKTRTTDIIRQNKVFIWIALATAFVLLLPFLAMQFTGDVAWSLFDFVTAGALLFGTGSIFVLAARRVDEKYRVAIGIVLAAALLYLWIELAVGIFFNFGS
jgi:hypothetical protein